MKRHLIIFAFSLIIGLALAIGLYFTIRTIGNYNNDIIFKNISYSTLSFIVSVFGIAELREYLRK